MKKYLIYKTTNIINNMVYVGAHQTKDINDGYMGSGKYLKSAINKYGEENFEKVILGIFENEKDMYEAESLVVDETFVKRQDTYNIKPGGFGGWTIHNSNSELQRKKAEKSHEKQRELAKNNYWSKKKSKKLSISLKEQYLDGRVAKFNGQEFFGKKHTEETKKKIGEINSKHQSGEGNSQYGSMWIYSMEEGKNKKIPKEEYEIWEQKGWGKGRKMIF